MWEHIRAFGEEKARESLRWHIDKDNGGGDEWNDDGRDNGGNNYGEDTGVENRGGNDGDNDVDHGVDPGGYNGGITTAETEVKMTETTEAIEGKHCSDITCDEGVDE